MHGDGMEWKMIGIFRRIGLLRRKPRATRVIPTVRLHLEPLEDRDLPAPLAPTGVVATGISASAVSLTWNAATDPTVTGYDVYAKVWYSPPHGGKGSSFGGRYVYNLLGSNLHTNSDTFTGLRTGNFYTYVVTAVNTAGQSPFSLPASAETWIAPSFPNGPNTFLLSSGALWSGPVNVTAGQWTELSLLISGNPLTFSFASALPSGMAINNTGVLTYKPALGVVGTVNVTVEASNPLGFVTETLQFNVAAANRKLATPTLKMGPTTSVYNGTYQQVSAIAVGKDGVTPVAGSYAIAYGRTGYPIFAGTYQLLVTFTSLDPKYGNATLLTNFTVTKATPAFSYLSTPTIAVGAATITVSGHIGAGTAVPSGDYAIMTLNGVSQEATVDANGNFSSSFATGALPVGTYTITYSFAGDANYKAANGAGTLQVVPLAVPVVTLNPSDRTTTAGDGVTFTATATGSPVVAVQWQVSADGGLTFTNVTSNTSAKTTSLSFYTNAGQNGYKYRAVFTNSAGTTTTSVATLTVEGDTGGGGGD
jgi:hypothetical protein